MINSETLLLERGQVFSEGLESSNFWKQFMADSCFFQEEEEREA